MMSIRRWRHWTHSSGDVKTIKIGWSWPACLFTVPWLIYKRMWQALIWLVPTGLLAAIAIATFETDRLGLDSIDIVIYPVILVSILFGLVGNKLYEDKLRKQFYHASKVYTSAKTRKHNDSPALTDQDKGSDRSDNSKRPPPIVFSASPKKSGNTAGGQQQRANDTKRIEPALATPKKTYSPDHLVNNEVVLLAKSDQPSPAKRKQTGLLARMSRRLRRQMRPVSRIAASLAKRLNKTLLPDTKGTAPESKFFNPAGIAAGLALLAIFSLFTFMIFSPPTPQIVAFKPANTTPPQDTGTENSASQTANVAPDDVVEPILKENLAELSINIDGLFDAVTDTLTTVTDKTTAIRALPQLHYLNGKAEDLQLLCASLPADSRSILRDMIDASMTELLDVATRATQHKDTAKVIGPVIETLTANLENFDTLESLALARQR